MVPKVYEDRDFSVHVYFSETTARHHLPHCHVRRGGQSLASVSLLTLEPFVGPALPRYIRHSLTEHLDELWGVWSELNG